MFAVEVTIYLSHSFSPLHSTAVKSYSKIPYLETVEDWNGVEYHLSHHSNQCRRCIAFFILSRNSCF